jgi:hypothetical protein
VEHRVQAPLPAGATKPLEQGLQVEEPPALYVPAGQVLQLPPLKYSPAGQKHTVPAQAGGRSAGRGQVKLFEPPRRHNVSEAGISCITGDRAKRCIQVLEESECAELAAAVGIADQQVENESECVARAVAFT